MTSFNPMKINDLKEKRNIKSLSKNIQTNSCSKILVKNGEARALPFQGSPKKVKKNPNMESKSISQ